MNKIEVMRRETGQIVIREIDNKTVLGEVWIELFHLPDLLKQLQEIKSNCEE